MSEIVQRLRSAALAVGACGTTDEVLLGDFVRHRDTEALAELVRRHGPMVWGVCRRLLHHRHDAEDAFQATFLVLVKKAARIADPAAVGNWLYGVANQTAVRVRATTAKTARREQQVATMPDPPVPAADTAGDLRHVLDAELARLPDKYRAVIVLCDLEGRTRTEVARSLGVPEGTAASRLTRARAILGKRLVRRGVTSGAVAGVAPGAAAAGVPSALVASTTRIAALISAGQAGSVPAAVSALTQQVLFAMTMKKITTLALVLFAAAATGLGGLAVARPQQAAKPAVVEAKRAAEEAKRAADPPKLDGTRWRFEDEASPVTEFWFFSVDGELTVETVVKAATPGTPAAKPVRSPDGYAWSVDRADLTVVLNSKQHGRNFARFTGTITGDVIRGKVQNKLGWNSEFTLTRINAAEEEKPAAEEAKRAAGGARGTLIKKPKLSVIRLGAKREEILDTYGPPSESVTLASGIESLQFDHGSVRLLVEIDPDLKRVVQIYYKKKTPFSPVQVSELLDRNAEGSKWLPVLVADEKLQYKRLDGGSARGGLVGKDYQLAVLSAKALRVATNEVDAERQKEIESLKEIE